MMCALTSVGGNPLLEQGGAGLHSSGSAFDQVLPFALNFSRDPALRGCPGGSNLQLLTSNGQNLLATMEK